MLSSPGVLWNSFRRSLPPPFRSSPEEDNAAVVVRKTKTHNYVLDRRQIGLGGFSNVYAAQLKKRTHLRNRLSISALRKKFGHEEESSSAGLRAYQFAIKVCELNAENVALPTVDEYGEFLFACEMPPQMAVAELDMLMEEAEILKSLQPSRYVVKLHDCFILTTSEQFWMVMERLVIDMESVFPTGLLGEIPNARASFLKQVLDGLTYLKESRIVHGDIKPSNLLLSSTGFVKICDFGIAKRLAEGEKLVVEMTKGSPPFMAPELWVEGFEYDYAVDLFAFGCVAYASMENGRGPIGDMFTSNKWKHWITGNAKYFGSTLGSDYLSLEEREESRSTIQWADFEDKEGVLAAMRAKDSKYDEFFESNKHFIMFIRDCLIPMPTNGPNGEVTRPDIPLRRAYIEEVHEMDYFKNTPNEFESRKSLIEVVQALRRKAAEKSATHTQEPSL